MSDKHAFLVSMQALPLEEKVHASLRRIREWFAMFPDATVSFSGGKDSTVLLDLVRSVAPETPAVFANTGLEYPEIVSFARAVPNLIEVRPKMSFLEVVQKYGYPVVSKRIAQYVGQVQRSKGDTATKRLRLTGIKEDGSTYRNASISQKWRFLCDSGIPISDKCCDRLKKECLRQIPHPFIGAMAADSEQRGQTYYREGCNSPTADRSWPMAFWREEDVWAYIRSRNLPYSSIYDMGYKRTGCVFCMFGLGLEGRPHRFDRMAVTHPQLYRYCMDGPLQLRKVITTVYGPAMAELWNDPQPDLDFLK